MSLTSVKAEDATVPPEPRTWKNSLSGNSQAFDRVRDEHELEARVLAAQPLHHPEEERLGELPVAVAHAGGDVHGEEHDGLRRGLAAHHELAEAQVVVRERRALRVHGAALEALLQRAAPVEARAHAAPAPALALVVVVLRWRRSWPAGSGSFSSSHSQSTMSSTFSSRSELHAALVVAALALAVVALLLAGLRELVAGLDVALAGAGDFLGIAQAEAEMLEELAPAP